MLDFCSFFVKSGFIVNYQFIGYLISFKLIANYFISISDSSWLALATGSPDLLISWLRWRFPSFQHVDSKSMTIK